MANINRSTLPSNFIDSVNAALRLPQPEPQYIFAKMAIAAGLRLGMVNAGLSTVQQYGKLMSGGAEVSPELDELVRFADALPGAVQAVNGFGKGKGDTITFNRDVYEGGGYDLESRRVQGDKPTSLVGMNVKGEQTKITLDQFEGPYSSENSLVQPYAISNFDAQYKANSQELAGIVSKHLQRDVVKLLDTVIRDQFRLASGITYGSDAADVAAFTTGAGKRITAKTVLKARKALTDREVSPFGNTGRYLLVVPSAFHTQMIEDSIYRELSREWKERNQIFGMIGKLHDIDIIESSTLKTYVAGTSVGGATVPLGESALEALLIAPGAVGMGIGQNPEVFHADDTNYGKDAKVIWRAIWGFQTLDERFVQRIIFQADT